MQVRAAFMVLLKKERYKKMTIDIKDINYNYEFITKDIIELSSIKTSDENVKGLKSFIFINDFGLSYNYDIITISKNIHDNTFTFTGKMI